MTQHEQTTDYAETTAAPPTPSTKPKRPRGTRSDQLAKMLATKRGADVTAIGAKFGWQPHTVRAALSALRKAGHTLVRDVDVKDKPSRYRIVRDVADAQAEVARDEG